MTSPQTFTEYAALLRDFIRRHSTGGAAHEPEPEFDQLALALFALQFSHNPGYKRFCEARKVTTAAIHHWAEIPAMPASAFKELELTSLAPAGRSRVFHSSGTTEQRPARHFHDAESLGVYEASLLAWFKCHLTEFGTNPHLTPALSPPFQGAEREKNSTADGRCGRFISLTPPPEVAPHSSLVHMFATVHREFGSRKSGFTGRVDRDGSWLVDVEQTLAAMRDGMADQEAVTVMGTAFNFVQLLDELEASSLRLELPVGSRVLETGGYKGRSRALPKGELHAGITTAFGIPPARIISEYGMCELSSQAYDLKLKTSNLELDRVFRFPPWARVRIVSPEDGAEVGEGETGMIRVFDLANLRSVLAVQTEDLGIRRGGGFELVGRAALAEARGCSLMSV